MNEKNIVLNDTKEKTAEQDSNVYMLKKPFEYRTGSTPDSHLNSIS